MSRTVDERIVSMQFDNKNFESNVRTSLSTLDKLKKSLHLEGASKGLENVNAAAKKVDMGVLGRGVETVTAKFSALQVMGVTALANLTNSAVNAGRRLVSALTMDPIKDGFAEYETQMNAVQTILANTQKEGTNVKIVNAALDELNHYADKTIYNFTEMTRNIGTFTAAGVKLDTSVSSIKGIANLAAVSGSTSQQASTAMYQLSQAIASGTVKLMDWNSVVNAGMGGQVFQDALVRTAEHLKTGAKAAIKAKGSFRESLTTGWLTTEVLTQTLDQFATAADTREEYEAAVKKFVEQGYSQEEAKQMADMAKTAGEAATKVKTFTQLLDTLKEALGSGWTESWRMIIGDFEEAKKLWTSVSDYLSDAINKSSDARNAMISEWVDAGGRNDLIQSFKNAFEGISSIVKPIQEAFRDIFPPMTSKRLVAFTEGLKNLTAKIKISDETAAKLKSTFSGLFSVVSMLSKVLLSVGKAFGNFISSAGVKSLVDHLLSATAAIGDFLTSLNTSFDSNGLTGVLSRVGDTISNVIEKTVGSISNFDGVFSKVGENVLKVASTIWSALKTVFGWITDHFSIGDLFAGLAGGGVFLVTKKLSNLIASVKNTFEGFFSKEKRGGRLSEIADNISEILGSVHDSIESFTTGIKATTLLSIAAAIGILSASLRSISTLDAGDITKSLAAIASMFTMLNVSFRSINKTISKYDAKGLIKAGASILLISSAIKTLATAMVKLSSLSLKEIAKDLIAIGGGLSELCIGLRIIDKIKIKMSTSVAMLALAESCKIFADAIGKFGALSWSEIAKGLTGMGGALAELVAVIKLLGETGGIKTVFNSAGLLIAVQSLSKLADGLHKFGTMSWNNIARGLAGMGGALVELGGTVGTLGKISGFKSILGSSAMLISVQTLGKLADGLSRFGSMSWDEIKHGLVAMGGALVEVGTTVGTLGKLGGFKSTFASGAILMMVQGINKLADAMQKFGGFSWDEIGKSLTGMGGALAELSVTSGALGKLAGFSALLGSGSIVLLIQGLGKLSEAFSSFGSMSWENIARGLTGMGGALAELGVISGSLGALAGLPSLIGGGSLLLAVQSLSDLADAFKKFGEMSWDQIGRGLSAMGGVLGETALGSLANTFSGLGALSIKEVAEPLGTLADSVKKWANVTVPEGLNDQLRQLASGIRSFTFDGFGASALSIAAPGVGTLADSVKKWAGVTVPEELGDQLRALASGIRSFTFDGFGASALSSSAPALGQLADSISKWSNVTIPDSLESGLKEIASGVKAFTLAFAGGLSLNTVITPLGELAGSVKKWSGVTVPDGLESGLKRIANGVKAFSLAFAGGWSLDTVVNPLGQLAGSVRKWSSVKVPEEIGDDLKQLASGVKAFSLAFLGGATLSTIVKPLGDLASSVRKWSGVTVPDGIDDDMKQLASGVKAFNWAFLGSNTLSKVTAPIGNLASAIRKWNGVTVPSDIGTQLSNLASGVKSFAGITDISSTVTSISKISNAMSTLSRISFGTVGSGLSSMATSLSNFASSTNSLSGVGMSIVNNIITPIKNAGPQMSSAAVAIISAFASAITSGNRLISSAFSSAISRAIDDIKAQQNGFRTAGMAMMNSIQAGVVTGGSSISPAVLTVISQAIVSISNTQAKFNNAGMSLMSAVATGIKSGTVAVRASIGVMITACLTNITKSNSKFINGGRSLMVAMASGVRTGSSVVTALLSSFLNNLVSSIRNRNAQFDNAGRSLIIAFASGLRSGGPSAQAAASSIANNCASKLSEKYSTFYSAGKHLADGFANGISANSYKAAAKAKAMAEAAAKAARSALKINSPSKVFRAIAYSIPEGFAQGIDRMSWMSDKSAKDMAESTLKNTGNVLSRIKSVVENDTNTEPTIRPVLDMSSIQPGNLQLTANATVAFNKPVASLAQMITDYQTAINASNREVVSAVNGLREDIAAFAESDGQEVALYVDSKKLATSLAKPMNRQLNILSKRGAY